MEPPKGFKPDKALEYIIWCIDNGEDIQLEFQTITSAYVRCGLMVELLKLEKETDPDIKDEELMNNFHYTIHDDRWLVDVKYESGEYALTLDLGNHDVFISPPPEGITSMSTAWGAYYRSSRDRLWEDYRKNLIRIGPWWDRPRFREIKIGALR